MNPYPLGFNMRWIKDIYHGISTKGIDSNDGLALSFESRFLPHGRIIEAELRSTSGVEGELKIISSSSYDQEPDINRRIRLQGEVLKEAFEILDLSSIDSIKDRVRDGWRIRAKGFIRGGYYHRDFVIGDSPSMKHNIAVDKLKRCTEYLVDVGKT
jgi:hypothetical protein